MCEDKIEGWRDFHEFILLGTVLRFRALGKRNMGALQLLLGKNSAKRIDLIIRTVVLIYFLLYLKTIRNTCLQLLKASIVILVKCLALRPLQGLSLWCLPKPILPLVCAYRPLLPWCTKLPSHFWQNVDHIISAGTISWNEVPIRYENSEHSDSGEFCQTNLNPLQEFTRIERNKLKSFDCFAMFQRFW